MWWSKPAYFLLPLVLSLSIDDLWAAATPDPADDDWAAENHTFVLSVRPFEWGRPAEKNALRDGTAGVHKAHVSDTASVRHRRPGRNALALLGSDPLYALMSLQR